MLTKQDPGITGFSHLSSEVSNIIYELALAPRNLKYIRLRSRVQPEVSLGLLRTCRAIQDES